MAVVPIAPEPIGGSQAAAACGIDPFCSRVELYQRKVSGEQREASEAMTWGTLLEPVIADVLRERGYDVVSNGSPIYDPDRPWLVGHPDGYATVGSSLGVVEIKTASWRQSWDDGVPVHYQAQVQHYLHLTGFERAVVACLIGGQRLEVRELDRDQRAIDHMLAAEHDFWQHVVNGEPPAPDGSKSAADALLAMFPNAHKGLVHRCDADLWRVWWKYLARREQRLAVQAQEDEYEAIIKAAIGDADTLISPRDAEVAHWRNVSRTALDVTRLRKEAPHIYTQYAKETTTRRFTLA